MKILSGIVSLSLAMAIILFGCGKDEDGPSIGAIGIKASSEVVEVGGDLTLTATSQSSEDITDLVEFYVNDSQIEGNVYRAETEGDLIIYATYGSIQSSKITVRSIKRITSIEIVSDKSVIKPIGTDVAKITARDQDDTEITSLMEFYVNGIKSENGNEVSSSALGEIKVTAMFEGLTSNEIVIESDLTVSSLALEVSRTSLPADSYSKSEITVIDQDMDDITPFVSIFSNDQAYSETAFLSGAPGTYSIKAQYDAVESNTVEITVDPFTVRKVLIEEFTGEWCGWCPQAAFNLDLLVKEHPYVLTVGIHNGDGLAYANESNLRSAFGIDYFPSGVVGRVNLGSNVGFNGVTLDSRVTDEIDRQIYESEVLAGVGIASSINGSEASIDVDVYFYQNIADDVRVTIYLIENDVVSGTQENYFSGRPGYENTYYYSQPASITNYEHQYVLRAAATDIEGEQIPTSDVIMGTTYSLSNKTIDITGYDPAKCYVIAFAHYNLDGKQEIINAQQVKLGESTGTHQ